MTTALLLSGGMDSIAIAYWQRPNFAFTIDYGQLAANKEIIIAKKVCDELNISHHILTFNLKQFGSGDLVGTATNAHAPASDWWPYRNQMLITLAAMYGIKLGINKILIGSVKSDNYHIDGSKVFVNAMNKLLSLQEGHLELEAPALDLTTTQLVLTKRVPIELLGWAHSCHKGDYACGQCRGCYKYFEVWNELQEQGYGK